MKIIIVTHYNFAVRSSGATNRVLELAKTMSKYTSIKILHRGPSTKSGNLQFIGYKPSFPFNAPNRISDATSPYISCIFPDFYRVLKRAIGDADVVQVEQPYLLIPTLILTKALDNDPLVVLDEHNADFMAVKSKITGLSSSSLLTMTTLPYVFLAETIAVKNAVKILCVSFTDRTLLMNLYGVPRNRLLVVPNGVNMSKFEKAPLVNENILESHTAFFHGILSWYPNQEAANIIVEYLAPRMPNITFLIAGSHPPAFLLRKISKTKNVKYLGFLNNLEGWINSSDVCIAPISSGGGTRLKLLEYAAAGKPIVATYKAIEGLPFVNKMHALVFNDVGERFTEAINNVLLDSALAEGLGSNARRLAVNFDWNTIGRMLYDKYASLLSEMKK